MAVEEVIPFVINPEYWLIFGLFLVFVEFFTATFAIIWFGIAALIVAAVTWLYPSTMGSWQIQIIFWIIFSVLTIVFWFKAFKPASKLRQINAGLNSGEFIGEMGVLIKVPTPNYPGTIRFTVAMFGKTEWHCSAKDDSMKVGDRVVVKDVVKNLLIIDKAD